MKNKLLRVSHKTLLLIVMIALALTGVHTAAAEGTAEFSDVSVNWSYKHITKLALLGVINGRGDGTFAPNDPVTHQEVLIMATQLMGVDEDEVDRSSRDVLPDHMQVSEWAKGYVSLAIRNGLINIQEERDALDRMREDEDELEETDTLTWGETPATREWVAKVTVRAAGKQAQAELLADQMVTFADRSSISPGFEGYINAAVQLDIVSGMPGNVFNPTDPVTRAQMAVFLSKAEAYMDGLSDRVLLGTLVELSDDSIVVQAGSEREYELHETVRYFSVDINDEMVSPDHFERGDQVYVIHDGSDAYYIERMDGEVRDSDVATNVVRGIVLRADEHDIELWADGNYETLQLSSSVIVADADGQTLSLDKLTTNMEVAAHLNAADEVVEITVTHVPVSKYSSGVLKTDQPDERLTVLDDYTDEEEEYPLADDVQVEYDGRAILTSDLQDGDEIEYRVADGIITRIELIEPVEPLMQQLEGELVAAVDSLSPVITLRTNEGPAAFDIDQFVEVVLPGKPSAKLSDLEAGDRVRIGINELNGNVVEKIEVLDRSIRMVAGATVVYFDGERKTFIVDIPGEDHLQPLQVNDDTTIEQIPEWDEELIEMIYPEGRKIDLTFTNQKLMQISIADSYDGSITSIDQSNRKIYIHSHDFGDLEFTWSTSTHMESDRNNASIADFLVGDQVRITIGSGNNHAASIRLMHQSAYQLLATFPNRRELLVHNGSGTETLRLERSAPVIDGNQRNARLEDLPLDHTVIVSHVGDTVASVELPAVEYGRVISAVRGQKLEVETYDGELLKLASADLSGVKRDGTTRSGGLAELRNDERVEIASDENGKYWVSVLERETKQFWKFDETDNRISFYTNNLSQENEFDLHEHVYVHEDGEEIRVGSLQNRDDVDVWFLYEQVVEIERK